MSKTANIQWFPVAQGVRGRVKETVLRITFSNKPKGVRFNVTLTKALLEKDIKYVKIGVENDTLFIKPMAEAGDNVFNINGRKKSASVYSAAIGVWAEQNGLIGQSGIPGEYDEKNDIYEFNLKEFMNQEVAATKEDTSK